MESLNGKTVLITGATDGLGKLVAHHAAAGAGFILHRRNPEKGAAVVSEIKAASGNGNFVYDNADFASL